MTNPFDEMACEVIQFAALSGLPNIVEDLEVIQRLFENYEILPGDANTTMRDVINDFIEGVIKVLNDANNAIDAKAKE